MRAERSLRKSRWRIFESRWRIFNCTARATARKIVGQSMQPTEAIREAVAALWAELPALVGPDWRAVEPALMALLRKLDSPPDAQQAASDIIDLFGRYPEARQRLLAGVAQLVGRQIKGVPEVPLPSARRERFTVVPVCYATDRAATGALAADVFYGGERGELAFGIAEVSIPDDHRMGELEKPRWWRLEFRADPARHVVLLDVRPLERPIFVARAREMLQGLARPHVLVFVHGFNVSFADAARRTAQIAYDLQFDGVPMLYSWPSAAQVHKYTVDETNIRWTQVHFRQFLQLCAGELGAQAVHVIAHSMGNRALAETLALPDAERPPHAARLREVILAAPDIDAATFRQLAAQFHNQADRCTLYASSKDEALKLSKQVHGYPRAGDSGAGLTIVAGVDTIDATDIDTSLVGHSYYGDNRSILSDIFYLLKDGTAPGQRFGLVPIET